jgi:hypothetical protein
MPLHVIVQYSNHPLPQRAAEYDECVRRNLANPHIAKLHNLVEPQTIVPAEFKSHPKYVQQPLPRWMTYRDAFNYANANLAGEIVCLCNLDIFLDPTSPWEATRPILEDRIVLCQSRIEFDPPNAPFKDPGFSKMAFANSQDAWLFVPPFEVPDCDFEVGVLGCDNAIADRIHRGGRVPVNLADRYRIFHYDRVRKKTSKNQEEVHASEASRRPQRHPEREGQYLVPNFDQVNSADEIINSLNVTPMERYQVICSVINQLLKIHNP